MATTGADPGWQAKMYRYYWLPLEKQFGEGHTDLDGFFQNYMAMQHKTFVRKGYTYKKFKEYMNDLDREEEIREIARHSKQYRLWGIFTHVNPWRVCDVIRTPLHAEPSPHRPLLYNSVGLAVL